MGTRQGMTSGKVQSNDTDTTHPVNPRRPGAPANFRLCAVDGRMQRSKQFLLIAFLKWGGVTDWQSHSSRCIL
jgi:hypothetical protein